MAFPPRCSASQMWAPLLMTVLLLAGCAGTEPALIAGADVAAAEAPVEKSPQGPSAPLEPLQQQPATEVAPDPTMSITCPEGERGPAEGPWEFGYDITAVPPYTVSIDYGDGAAYTGDETNLGAVFEHVYVYHDYFVVTATITDANGVSATAACEHAFFEPVDEADLDLAEEEDAVGYWCADGYVNVDGDCIPSPEYAPGPPAGASAECVDGTYSFSANRQGTCSWHGGVLNWL